MKALRRAGFEQIRCHGSHLYLYHRTRDALVTVPVHAGKTIAPKTLQSILKQAGISPDEFAQLL